MASYGKANPGSPWEDRPGLGDELRTLWDQTEPRLSTTEIGKRLGGLSKNTIVGKAHRMQLDPRPSPIRRGAQAGKATVLVQAETRGAGGSRLNSAEYRAQLTALWRHREPQLGQEAIAGTLGVSKSTLERHVKILRLEARPSMAMGSPLWQEAQAALAAFRKVAGGVGAASDVEPPAANLAPANAIPAPTLSELIEAPVRPAAVFRSRDRCQFPLNGGENMAWRWCEAPADTGPYCAQHWDRTHVKTPRLVYRDKAA